ncbi:DNA polymerase III subunit gamma/tau [Zooshikella harenae]|uniref:DNA polymerase III subunit gamma/tau n=1 Tax=Zooshikella harenae TaxID=2827238 RepID=A0ABS5ZEF3_9GAMM|nr:DNA polymerase III subunit gamma/tau [Zooshikella harenae]MBU2712442.1 DNA polymerase III subunit gamma/tau [Zooshikella harenae]
MSYQVLARKWRPRTFKQLVGQLHVLKALVNALDHDRLHHAYLFTGTRGVGKTSIARILAKSLNCEQGVSSEPCGQCDACREIDEGRFVDLIEVDAASRTKVEDTRELLENVQYAPTRGRYKVYLIDEVHMLSAHSFNALLKTLEEPPPHVKFLLATTDPQKLPVTILSRCLQFALKNMSPERIVGHLQFILAEENVSFDISALWQLARAADGSMRDALSLTDQAIAFGSGEVRESEVATMLGTIDPHQVFHVVEALAEGNIQQLLNTIAHLAEFAPDYTSVLADLLSVLHRIALAQMVPDAVDNSQGDQQRLLALAAKMTAEDVQLYYQIGLLGRRDLPLAPDPRGGFEMVMLRMLAFRPTPVEGPPQQALVKTSDGQTADAHVASMEVSATSLVDDVQQDSPTAEIPLPPKSSLRSHLVEQPEASPAPEGTFNPLDNVNASENRDASQNNSRLQVRAATATETATTQQVGLHDIEASAPPLGESSEQTSFQPNPLQQPVDKLSAGESGRSELNKQVAQTVAQHVSEIQINTSVARALSSMSPEQWPELFWLLGLGGVTQTLGSHMALMSMDQNLWTLVLDEKQSMLFSDTHQSRIEQAISKWFGESVRLQISTDEVTEMTPARWAQEKKAKRLAEAKQSIENDHIVQALLAQFSATIVEQSITPIDEKN